MRIRFLVVATSALVLIASCGDVAGWDRATTACTVRVDGTVVRLGQEQAANAATIAAVATQRGLDERAVVVALAVAAQESKLRNLDHGDRDSLGLFQQRPSQGWGTARQVRDPRHAAHAFFDHLERVERWHDMRVSQAAQAVQRSAYPEEYRKWNSFAGLLSRAVTGHASAALTCAAQRRSTESSPDELLQALRQDWGEVTAGDVDTGQLRLPVADEVSGWGYTSWLVAHAAQQRLSVVSFHGRTWHAHSGRWSRSEATSREVVVRLG